MSLTKKEKIKNIFKLITEPKLVYNLLSFRSFGYLLETGWINSFKLKVPVDKNDRPIPWFTYPTIDFIADKLHNRMNVLEFGSGNSTLFFARRVNNIISVEHNREWFDIISNLSPANSKILLTGSKNSNEYINPLQLNNQNYDMIIVDGIFRNDCIKFSIEQLTDRGIIILDDSERGEYAEGITHLLDNGFKQILFTGIAAGIFFKKSTSIFYKDKNCLSI